MPTVPTTTPPICFLKYHRLSPKLEKARALPALNSMMSPKAMSRPTAIRNG